MENRTPSKAQNEPLDSLREAIRNLEKFSSQHSAATRRLVESEAKYTAALAFATQILQDVAIAGGLSTTPANEGIEWVFRDSTGQIVLAKDYTPADAVEVRRSLQEVNEIVSEIRRARPRFEQVRSETRAILDRLESV